MANKATERNKAREADNRCQTAVSTLLGLSVYLHPCLSVCGLFLYILIVKFWGNIFTKIIKNTSIHSTMVV